LLEVGTGFHGEMTGRENVYLNGAILGMTKKEIASKIEEIIEFSGCQRYIDTPVKRYSSGMTVRLAFAVAAFLEPEILVIDEVLAVGDAEFQKKAIGKMQDISKGEGRTVLFVSHNMAAIKSLCTRAILLQNGEIAIEGSVEECIDNYLVEVDVEAHKLFDVKKLSNNKFVQLVEAKVLNSNDKISANHYISNEVKVEFTYKILVDNVKYTHGFNLFNNQNIHILSSHDKDSKTLNLPISKGTYKRTVIIPANLLSEGGYSCSFAIMKYKPFHVEINENQVVGFNVIDEINNKKIRGEYSGRIPGIIRPVLNWKD
jgi:lipopolysaccharide transport system ATP-binding protein